MKYVLDVSFFVYIVQFLTLLVMYHYRL